MSHFCKELRDDVEVRTNGDSSAVKGILARRRCGKVKHRELKQLWLQEQVRSVNVDFLKISCLHSRSDALTHHNSREHRSRSSVSCCWARPLLLSRF